MTEVIGDTQTWLQSRTMQEIAEDAEDLEPEQVEWLMYATKDDEIKDVLSEELEQRDEYSPQFKGMNICGEVFSEDEEDSDSETVVKKGSSDEVWDSGLEILESFGDLAEMKLGARTMEQYAKEHCGIEENKVIIPEEVRKTCVAIQEEVNSDYGGACEFGVLFKGEWTEDGFVVQDDYVIPEQKASRAHITYKEDLKKYRDEGYIVNAHSHPWAGESSNFSKTDDDHINSHFDMALLFGGGAETIVDARAIVEVEDGVKARIKPEVQVEQPEEELPDVDTESVDFRGSGGSTKKSSSKRNKRRQRQKEETSLNKFSKRSYRKTKGRTY